MLVDSHCHLNFSEMPDIQTVLQAMQSHEVSHALCVSINLPQWHEVMSLAETYPNIYASVGVHPDYQDTPEPSVADLTQRAQHPKVIAIGETGLDYFRINHQTNDDMAWQRERFRTHIRAAISVGKPLIIHTRQAAEDTIAILREEHAEQVGGVMHCFTEDLVVAEQAMELGFYISFSGIVTFKNAHTVKEVAQRIPLERMLIETDSPYLAPVPYRGKTNQPAYVRYVAEEIAHLRGISWLEIAQATTQNFFCLFSPQSR